MSRVDDRPRVDGGRRLDSVSRVNRLDRVNQATSIPSQTDPLAAGLRDREALLLLLALVIGLFAYADVGLGMSGHVPSNLPELTLIFGAGLGAAHLAVRRVAPYADPVILPTAAMINGLGLALIYRLDPYNIAARLAPASGAAPSQATYTLIGLAAFVGVLFLVRDHRRLQRYLYLSALAGLLLVGLPAVLPASMTTLNGASSWIILGGFQVEPAEFGKLLLVSFFASYLHSMRDTLVVTGRSVLGLRLPRGRDLGPLLLCWVIAMLVLIRETDLGVSMMFFGAFVIMLYLATERASWLIFGLVMFVGGAAGVAETSPHVMGRFSAWVSPFSAVGGNSRQVAQSLYAFANGGLTGTGLGLGEPYLVGFANNADFILDTVGEELGLFGLTALLLAYGLITARGFKIAMLARDSYGKLLAAGLAAVFALEVFITAGGVMRVIPLTGLPMPFLAVGGSALVSNWILVAILLRISDAAGRPPAPVLPLP